MPTRLLTRSVPQLISILTPPLRRTLYTSYSARNISISPRQLPPISSRILRPSLFHTSASWYAQSASADAFMESLNDLYATAKDEFEIAAEETEKKTVYAQDDRDAAREALDTLKQAFEKAVRESAPDVGKEVTSRVGPRIRELENAVTAMEESAMED